MLFLEGVISARLYNGVRKGMANNMAHIDNMQQRERGKEKPRFEHLL